MLYLGERLVLSCIAVSRSAVCVVGKDNKLWYCPMATQISPLVATPNSPTLIAA